MRDLEYGNAESSRTQEVVTVVALDANGALATIDRFGGQRTVRVPNTVAGVEALIIGNKVRVATRRPEGSESGVTWLATAILQVE